MVIHLVVAGGAGSVTSAGGVNSVGVIINGTGGNAQAGQQGSFKKGGNSFHGVGGSSGTVPASGFGYGGPFSGGGDGGGPGLIIVYSIG